MATAAPGRSSEGVLSRRGWEAVREVLEDCWLAMIEEEGGGGGGGSDSG